MTAANECTCDPGIGVFTFGCTEHRGMLPSIDELLPAARERAQRHAEQEMDVVRGSATELAALYESATAETARVAAERDQLAVAVAGWVARFHAAYEALYIEEFDGDSCPDLEATIEYAIGAYRRVCESEAAAADQISLLRAELASARAELKQLREHQEIRARVIREKNAKLREIEHLLGIDAIYPPRDVADAVRELLAGLEQLRAIRSWIVARDGGRDCHDCDTEIRRGEAYELVPDQGLDALRHIHCPTSKETTMPATADEGPIADPMITAATEAIWPHLPSEVQESCYGPAAITSWAAAGAAAALRVMADEIDRGPTFSLPPSVISALVRERANRLTDVPERGAR